MRCRILSFAWVAVVGLLPPVARAAHTVDQAVLGMAGGIMSGGSISLQFTLGELVVGGSSGGSSSMAGGFWGGVPGGALGVEEPELRTEFSVQRVGANPFAPGPLIHYAIPGTAAVPVSVIVYDVRGAAVRTLVHELKAGGEYAVEWNGRGDHGAAMGAGVYFVRFRAGPIERTFRVAMLQ